MFCLKVVVSVQAPLLSSSKNPDKFTALSVNLAFLIYIPTVPPNLVGKAFSSYRKCLLKAPVITTIVIVVIIIISEGSKDSHFFSTRAKPKVIILCHNTM